MEFKHNNERTLISVVNCRDLPTASNCAFLVCPCWQKSPRARIDLGAQGCSSHIKRISALGKKEAEQELMAACQTRGRDLLPTSFKCHRLFLISEACFECKIYPSVFTRRKACLNPLGGWFRGCHQLFSINWQWCSAP